MERVTCGCACWQSDHPQTFKCNVKRSGECTNRKIQKWTRRKPRYCTKTRHTQAHRDKYKTYCVRFSFQFILLPIFAFLFSTLERKRTIFCLKFPQSWCTRNWIVPTTKWFDLHFSILFYRFYGAYFIRHLGCRWFHWTYFGIKQKYRARNLTNKPK